MLIGTFILAFGELEQLTYAVWARCCQDKHPPNTLGNTIKELVTIVKAKPELSAAIPKLLDEVQRLATYRNTIAHNPLSLQVLKDEASGIRTPIIRIASRKGDEHVTSEQLRRAGKQAQRLAQELTSAFWLRDVDGDA